MNDHRPLNHYLYLVFLAGAWGTSFMFVKISVATIPPITTAAVRVTVATLILLAVLFYQKKPFPTDPKFWMKASLLGLVGTALPYMLLSWGMQFIGSGTAAICMSFIPLTTFFLAHFMTEDEKMSWRGLAGILMGIVGILVLFYQVAGQDSGTSMSYMALGALLITAFGYALVGVLVKTLGSPSPVKISMAMLLVSALFLWPFALIFEQPWLISPSRESATALLFLSIISTALPTLVMVWLINQAGATFMSYNTYLVPLVGVLAGYVWLDEALKETTLVSLIFILAGIYIAQRKKKNMNG